MITEYTVIEEDSPSEITEAVNKLIAEGWQPLGGVACMTWTHSDGEREWFYSQAMVKQDSISNYFAPAAFIKAAVFEE